MHKPFEKITVIGAGTLGSQIALLAANAGYKITIYDVRKEAFYETVERLHASIKAKGVEPFIPWERVEFLKREIRQENEFVKAVKDAELVVEAVPEDLTLKRKVFDSLGRNASPNAILATNSSSIPVSRIEDSSGREENCVNTHFYMILEGMNMADVMGGTRTSPDIIRRVVAWVRSMECIPLTVKKELLGFCFNRVWRSVKREVLWMWGNDYVDFRDVDRAWMCFTKMKMGPFGLMDAVGLDVIHGIEMVYYNDSGDPRDKPSDALKEKIDRGELGVKTGKGFYTYPNPEFLNTGFLKP